MASVRSVMPEPNDPLILLKPLRPLSIVVPSTVSVVPLWPRLEAEAAATACGWAATLFGGATPRRCWSLALLRSAVGLTHY